MYETAEKDRSGKQLNHDGFYYIGLFIEYALCTLAPETS